MQTSTQNAKFKLAESSGWLARARAVIPGCAQTFSKGPGMFVQGIAPNFLSHGDGAYVWDVDGTRYIDYISGLGPNILGYANEAVNEAVYKQMRKGVSFSLPHTIEVEVAELLRELIPCAEMVRFGKNGSDATSGAVRLARAFTGRDLVFCCGYHGWQDWYIGTTSRGLGVPEAVRQLTIPFPYNDLDVLRKLFEKHAGKVACVIMEPVSFVAPAEGYLNAVKQLCRENGALLVFDEIVTGFRLHLGGAQSLFGVTPDLACFGKAMANGFPLAAIVGRADAMRLFETVFFSFTFGGDAGSLAACKATIDEMRRNNVIAHLKSVGQKLKEGCEEIIRLLELGKRVALIGYPQWTIFSFKDTTGRPSMVLRSLFQQEVMRRGILTHGAHMMNFGHDDVTTDATLRAYREAFSIIADALAKDDVEKRLVGPPIQPVFRQV
jgi:glutamate-1-semialdehyde 2,1-aminomutase/spore coat polysaccharide biosynthesis protein SpsF